jgi:hypothetical protein
MDVWFDRSEPWKHQGKGKKPNTKDGILYDSIHVKCPEWQAYHDSKDGGGCQRLGD